MKNLHLSKEAAPRNHENNPIASRWEQVKSSRIMNPAVFAPDGRVLRTFGEVEKEAARWAETFAASASRVLSLQIGNRPEWPALVLAACRSDRMIVPMECDLPDRQRERIERLCGAGLRLACDSRDLAVVPLAPNPAPVDLGCDFIKLTSGTTAEPRVILTTARQLVADCDNICETVGLRGDDLNYGVVSFAHSYGFSNLITPLLCHGIPLVVASDVLPNALASGFAASGATVFPGVPAIFRALAEGAVSKNALRLCITAGAPLPRDVALRFFEKWGLKLHSLYGSSECGGICYDSSQEADVPAGYVGPPLKNVEVSGGRGRPSPIEVRSSAVATSYYPDQGNDNLKGGIFRPSDLLQWNGTGYIIAGRASDLINVGGRKVDPTEIERVLRLSPQVRDVVVLGLPDEARGEDVAACVSGSATEGELRRLCFQNLPPWQVPRRWYFWKEIPTNARGKISRAELRDRLV